MALLVERASVEAAEKEATRRNARFAFRSALRTAHQLLPQVPAPSPRGDEARARAAARLDLGRGSSGAYALEQLLASLLARAASVERPADTLREIARKVRLRAVELFNR